MHRPPWQHETAPRTSQFYGEGCKIGVHHFSLVRRFIRDAPFAPEDDLLHRTIIARDDSGDDRSKRALQCEPLTDEPCRDELVRESRCEHELDSDDVNSSNFFLLHFLTNTLKYECRISNLGPFWG